MLTRQGHHDVVHGEGLIVWYGRLWVGFLPNGKRCQQYIHFPLKTWDLHHPQPYTYMHTCTHTHTHTHNTHTHTHNTHPYTNTHTCKVSTTVCSPSSLVWISFRQSNISNKGGAWLCLPIPIHWLLTFRDTPSLTPSCLATSVTRFITKFPIQYISRTLMTFQATLSRLTNLRYCNRGHEMHNLPMTIIDCHR